MLLLSCFFHAFLVPFSSFLFYFLFCFITIILVHLLRFCFLLSFLLALFSAFCMNSFFLFCNLSRFLLLPSLHFSPFVSCFLLAFSLSFLLSLLLCFLLLQQTSARNTGSKVIPYVWWGQTYLIVMTEEVVRQRTFRYIVAILPPKQRQTVYMYAYSVEAKIKDRIVSKY